MSWHLFVRAFDKTVQNALRYSIQEACRRQCRAAGGGTSEGIANDAIETFTRKMAKHSGREVAVIVEECPCCFDAGHVAYALGVGDPHFKVCEACGNPKGLPSP